MRACPAKNSQSCAVPPDGYHMGDILTGTSIAAAVLGGMVALFAPCCISVMLPAYFATSFRQRRALVAMTFVFAAGVAAVILPIAFGASAVTRLVIDYHTPIFLVGGTLMLAMGAAMIVGWKPSLPLPGMRASTDRGPRSVFALGAFSGVASACCAPVLAGVVALSGATATFTAALAIGVGYVFGMVAPLFVIALLWERYDWGNGALLGGRSVSLGWLARGRSVQVTTLISGVLLLGMGALVIALAFTGTTMTPGGWQARTGARLQHYASVALSWIDNVPGWFVVAVLLAAIVSLARRAVRESLDDAQPRSIDGDTADEPSAADQRS